MNHDTIIVLDFGSQYAQLIARRVREQNVYSELVHWDAPAEQVFSNKVVKGFILSGGPASVYEQGAPTLPSYVLESGLPVLGICYGMQLLAANLGGRVAPSQAREYGPAVLEVLDGADNPLFAGLPLHPAPRTPHPVSDAPQLDVWMSHGDRIEVLPPGWRALARSQNSPYAAMGNPSSGLYALQFHPEVTHTPVGAAILRAFAVDVCGANPDWTAANFIEESVRHIRQQVGQEHVLCGLSGGVDSSVVAALLYRAIGDQLTCLFVDHGLLRLGEAQQVVDSFERHMHARSAASAGEGVRLVAVNAAEAFLSDLVGIVDPEHKRKLIGHRFVRVFEEEAARIAAGWDRGDRATLTGRHVRPSTIGFLAQGTLYPDVIESASGNRERAAHTIKTHHNVGGLPEDMTFRLIEPLRLLFKDEVRAVGQVLGLPEEIVWRHPFPGPGLAIRVLGEVTWERLETLRQADAVLLEELRAAGLYRQTAQVFAVLLPVKSVGVMGDSRTYADVIAIRAVTSDDFMTADWARLPHDLLARISNRIVNEVIGVNRVVYDITSKPPGTIEWE